MGVITTTSLPIDYMYYFFRPNNFNETCYEESSVMDDMVYANDIIIQCAVTKPYALMNICIRVDIQNEYLQLSTNMDEKAVVPKHCHPFVPPKTTPIIL